MRLSLGARGASDALLRKRLLQEGCSVAICGTTEEGVNRAVEEMKGIGSGKVGGCKADVGKNSDVESLIAFVSKEFGGLDFLINNAGPGCVLERCPICLRKTGPARSTRI